MLLLLLERENSADVTVLVNTDTNTMTMGTQAELLGIVVRKIHRDPSLASVITDLYHGSYRPVDVAEVDGKPVVDT